jgi:hypothetical protein
MKRLLVLFLALSLSGCAAHGPYHAAVVVNHDARTITQTFQQVEIDEFNAGRLSVEEHRALEAGIGKVGLAGQSVTMALQQAGPQSDVLAKVNALVQAVADLNASGVLGIKDPNAKAALSAAIKGIQDLLVNLQKEAGAPQ